MLSVFDDLQEVASLVALRRSGSPIIKDEPIGLASSVRNKRAWKRPLHAQFEFGEEPRRTP